MYKDIEECKGRVHLGKGWKNKYTSHKVRYFKKKKKGKNGELYRDKMENDLLCNPKMFGLYPIYNG